MTNTLPDRIDALRDWMRREGVDVLLVPRADAHHVEWLRPARNLVQRFCGFEGSYAKLIVDQNNVVLITSGIYVEAAEKLLAPQGIKVVDDTDYPLDIWCAEQLTAGTTLALDPWLHSSLEITTLSPVLERGGIVLKLLDENPLEAIAPPTIEGATAAWSHPEHFSGQSAGQKITTVSDSLRVRGVDAHLLSAPDSICWLLNIRGADVFDTPLVYAFALIHASGKVGLYIDPEKVNETLLNHLGLGVTIHPYASIDTILLQASSVKVLEFDRASTSHVFETLSRLSNIEIVDHVDPCQILKCAKNEVELAGAQNAHLRDGVAQVRFWSWWTDRQAAGEAPTEREAEEKINELRGEDPLFHGVSFRTISASGGNASMPHYHTDLRQTVPLAANNFFLLDSGGQYLDGTTDVTRTYPVGSPTNEMLKRYTQVMKGLIASSSARFPTGTRGYMLDSLARQALWADGVNYPHATGHGVGSFLGVHEGPVRLRARPDVTALVPGMIVSIEPGYYSAGQFGIRHENLVAVIADHDALAETPFLKFETLTLCPFDVSSLVLSMITPSEIKWLDDYHARVRSLLGPHVDGSAKEWLLQTTQPISQQRDLNMMVA